MFPLIAQIQAHKVLLNNKELLASIKNSQNKNLAQKKDEVLRLITAVNALLAKPEHFSQTQKMASLFLLADAYSYLSMLYSNAHKREKPMMRKAEKALNQAIECLDLINQLLKEPSEIIDFEFVKKCNTFGICDIKDALDAINNHLIDVLIENTADEKSFAVSSTSSSSTGPKGPAV